MRPIFISLVVFSLLSLYCGALRAEPVRLEDDPGQGIGKKPCGSVWVGFNEPCPGDRVYAPIAPTRPVFIPNMNPDPTCLDHPGLNTKEDERSRNVVYVQPSKKEIEKHSVLVHLAQAQGLRWGCGRHTIDQVIFKHDQGDQCALGLWSMCNADWNPTDGITSSGRKTYTGTPPPLAERIAMLLGLQEELGVPPEMRMKVEDCTEKWLPQYEMFASFRQSDVSRAYWSVECMSKGLGMRLAITPQVKEEKCDDKYYKDKRCVTIEFEADGVKVRAQGNPTGPEPQVHARRQMQVSLACDVRLAKRIAAAPDDPAFRFLTKADVIKLRHKCRFAEAYYAAPEVKAFFGGVAAQYDAFAATMKDR